MLRIVLTVLFILVGLAIVGFVLKQEGKTTGLGAVSGGGSEETFWSKNKERSPEGKLKRYTKYLGIAFMVLAAILNISRF